MKSSLLRQCITGAALLAEATLLLAAGAETGAQNQTQEDPAAAVAVTGTLDVLIVEDFKHNQAKTAYFVHEHGSHRFHELEFKEAPKQKLRTGQTVR